MNVLRDDARDDGGTGDFRDERCAERGFAFDVRRDVVEAGVRRVEGCAGRGFADGVRREDGCEGKALGVRRPDGCAGSAGPPKVKPKFPIDTPVVLSAVRGARDTSGRVAYPAPRWRMRRLSSRSMTPR